MQEAYHPPCSDYSFCCHNWVPPPSWSWRGEGYLPGSPLAGPGSIPPQLNLAGYPPRLDLAGYPPPKLDLAGYPPSVCPMAFWEMLQSIMGYGYPPVDRQIDGWMEGQTHVKTLPSRRTTYTGGNYCWTSWKSWLFLKYAWCCLCNRI